MGKKWPNLVSPSSNVKMTDMPFGRGRPSMKFIDISSQGDCGMGKAEVGLLDARFLTYLPGRFGILSPAS